MPPRPLAAEFPAVTVADWHALVARTTQASDIDAALGSRTLDGIPIKPLYVRADGSEDGDTDRGHRRDAGQDGIDLRTLHADADPTAVNAAILDDLRGGATSLHVQLAVPGQFGLPAKYTAIAVALAGVHLDMAGVGFAAGDQYLGAAQCLLALWDERGVPVYARRGAINADPLGHLARTGALEDGLWPALDTLAEFAAANTVAGPRVTLLLADGRPYHEAGASEAQELAAMLATLVAYLRLMETEKGQRPDQTLPLLSVGLSADSDLFLTIAKLRAARRLVWRVAEACGHGFAAKSVRVAVDTSARMLTTTDPDSNILRNTIATAGALLGGADALTVLPHTWALGRTDAHARRIARNTVLVLQEEAHLGRVLDPAGGSFYVERLTDTLAHAAWRIFQEIEAAGGMPKAMASGFVGDLVAATAEARMHRVEDGDAAIVGVTVFPFVHDRPTNVNPHPAPEAIDDAAFRMVPLPAMRIAEDFEMKRRTAVSRRPSHD